MKVASILFAQPWTTKVNTHPKSVQIFLKKALTPLAPPAIVASHTVNTNYKSMRTKALLSVAAIAASAVTAMAQSSVYSLNIVGYATVSVAPGFSLMANPLSAGVTNGANEIMPILDGEQILTWTGTSFSEAMYDSGAGGWVMADDVTKTVPPSLPPGVGFFFFNPNPAATNFTFVGQVVPGPSSTNTLTLPSGFSLIGSPLPATVAQITNPPVSLPVLDGMQILQWSGTKFNEVMFDSGAGGWVLADDVTKTTAPPYSIGSGFFFFNPNPTSNPWPQSLP